MTPFMFLFNLEWRISYLQLLLVCELLICRGTIIAQRRGTDQSQQRQGDWLVPVKKWWDFIFW